MEPGELAVPVTRRLTPTQDARLADSTAESVRRSHARAIQELQAALQELLATSRQSSTDVAGILARLITTTAPLTIDGGASADLSADRTLAVSTFGAASRGVVPLSGGGTTNFLRADGSWVPPVAGAQPYYDTILTPAAITFGVAFDNWNVGTLGQNTLVQYTTDGGGANTRSVRGLAGGSIGKIVTVMNMNTLTGAGQFEHLDATASAGNKFVNAGGGHPTGSAFGCVTWYHDGANWHQIGTT